MPGKYARVSPSAWSSPSSHSPLQHHERYRRSFIDLHLTLRSQTADVDPAPLEQSGGIGLLDFPETMEFERRPLVRDVHVNPLGCGSR